MNAPRKALIAWDFGDKMIALDTPRHPSTLALTSLELARSLPAKLEGGKRVASSDLRVHVPRMGTSSQSSLYVDSIMMLVRLDLNMIYFIISA